MKPKGEKKREREREKNKNRDQDKQIKKGKYTGLKYTEKVEQDTGKLIRAGR